MLSVGASRGQLLLRGDGWGRGRGRGRGTRTQLLIQRKEEELNMTGSFTAQKVLLELEMFL